jgi:hypothetical protein
MVVALVPWRIDRRRTIVRTIEAQLEAQPAIVRRIGAQLSAGKRHENGLNDERISNGDRSQAPPEAPGRAAVLCHADSHEGRRYG